MISEKEFALSYGSFWSQLFPMSEDFLRGRNRGLSRFERPLATTLPTDTRGVVNEVGFQLFTASIRDRLPLEELSREVVEQCIADSLHHIRDLRERSRAPVEPPDDAQIEEAKALAGRLARYFEHMGASVLVPFPHFEGCGWLDECNGDLFTDRTLVEVKAGERGFRSIDIRQVLTYCALNLASPVYQIERICLLNPRVGVLLDDSVETLCREVSGRSSIDVLNEILEFVSEPSAAYDGV